MMPVRAIRRLVLALTCGALGACSAAVAQSPSQPAVRAYATVDPGAAGQAPSLVLAHSRNFASVQRIGLGTYCLNFAPAARIDRRRIAAVVGLEAQASQLGVSNNVLQAYWYREGTDCPGAALEVVTTANPNPNAATAGSDAVAFSIIVV